MVRVLRGCPVFWDMSYGRTGSFIEMDSNGQGEFPVQIKWTPFNSAKIHVIRDVPPNSLLTVKPFDSRCQDEIVILLAGEHGEAPLLNNHMNKAINEIIKGMSRISRQAQVKTAAADTAQRLADMGADAVVAERMKNLNKITRKLLSDERKPRYLEYEDV